MFSSSIQHKKQIPGPITPGFRIFPKVRILFTKHNHKKHLILRGMFQFYILLVKHLVLKRACSVIITSSNFLLVRTRLASPQSQINVSLESNNFTPSFFINKQNPFHSSLASTKDPSSFSRYQWDEELSEAVSHLT